MPDPSPEPPREEQTYTRSQQIFLDASEELQRLVRDILREEREVMHLERRPQIHQKIVTLIRRHIA
jgi:hypothetical protein